MRAAWAGVLVLAGCLSPAPGLPTPPVTIDVGALLSPVVDHDHTDPHLHEAAHGLELLTFVDARDLLGDEAARLSDLQFHGTLATVAVNGRTGASDGGFIVLDVADALHPRLLGRYRSGSEDNWYTKWSPDGRYVFLTANGNTSPAPALAAVQESLNHGVPSGPLRGIHVVDVRDPSAPRLAGFWPAPVRVINLAPWTSADGSTWVFASIVEDRAVPGAAATLPVPLNHVSALRFDAEKASLLEEARWTPEDAKGPGAFAHDLAVAHHAASGRDLLYVAHWDLGGYIVDVTDPTSPATVAHVASLDAGDHVHTFKPHPEPLDGRHVAVMAPETFAGEASGTYRVLDVTDPTRPALVSQWSLPPGDVVNAENLLFSPHEFDLGQGRVYASQFHAGLWVLTLPDLAPVAGWQRALGAPGRTQDWALDVETAVRHNGQVWIVDMGTGITILEESDHSPTSKRP